MMSGRPRPGALVLVLLAPLLTGVAHAYLDPGTGSYVVQLVIGTVLGGLIAVGLFWRRVLSFLRGLFVRRRNGDADRR